MAPFLPVTRIASCHRSVARLVAGSILCAFVLVGTSTLAGAASSKASAARISAHLTKTSFTKEQIKEVKLIYSFSATSRSFGYLLSFKKGSKWLKVKSVKKTGTFRGSHEITVKTLFARPVKVGKYRLKLFADGGSKLLSFKAKGSNPINIVLPAISGPTTQGQALTASDGSWKNSPTAYAYRWRRCNSAGASCSDISGASANSYTLTAADVVGSTVRVVVTASNSYGAAGATSAQTAVGATVLAISAGDYHTCALSSWGTVKCWGNDDDGQLGDGTTTSSSTPVEVKGFDGVGALSSVTQISAGVSHTCALLTAGTVECWGWNGEGELGTDRTTNSSTPTPVQVKGFGGVGALSNVTQISVGGFHTCALLTDGTVECWGWNSQGQLGYSSSPVQVKGFAGVGALSNVIQISAGGGRTCALLADHTVECWGADQLGNGTTTSSSIPVTVEGIDGVDTLSNVTQISAGVSHTCALLLGGTVACWGSNVFGALGNGGTVGSTPVQVKGVGGVDTLSNVTQISTGDDDSCALLSSNTVECWGYNEAGQLGNGTRTDSSTPLPVRGVGGVGMF